MNNFPLQLAVWELRKSHPQGVTVQLSLLSEPYRDNVGAVLNSFSQPRVPGPGSIITPLAGGVMMDPKRKLGFQ